MANSASSARSTRTAAPRKRSGDPRKTDPRKPTPRARYGSETPRIWTKPLRPLTERTSYGFSVIKFADEVLEIQLLPWQKWLLIHALERRVDGSLRFRNVIVLVARQNGKSTLSQVLVLWWLYVCGCPTVLGTAQDLDTAEEVWEGAWEIIEAIPELHSLVDTQVKTNGKKAIRLLSGERYKVKAANRRAGRGLTGDRILLDELREHQSWDAWAAITKTTMARADAQVWCLSNAGDMTSVVLRYLRKLAHRPLGDPDGINAFDENQAELLLPTEADMDQIVERNDDIDSIDHLDFAVDEDDLGIFEWSAPPGCDVWDRDAWAQSNPAMGYTITERAIASAARTDPEWVFRVEVLCQWSEGGLDGPFPAGAWEECAAAVDKHGTLLEGEQITGRTVCSLEVTSKRSVGYVDVAGFRPDGLPQVEVVARRPGVDWIVDWFCDPDHPHRAAWPIVIQVGSPAWSLTNDLREAGLVVIEWTGRDLADGAGQIYDAVKQRKLRHTSQPYLNLPAGTAATQVLTNASWFWDRRRSPHDPCPLIAATGALWWLQQPVAVPLPPPPLPSALDYAPPVNDLALAGF